MPDDLYPAYRLLDRIMSTNLSVHQKATIGMRSVDQASCRELLGKTAICGIAADLPDVQRSDSFLSGRFKSLPLPEVNPMPTRVASIAESF